MSTEAQATNAPAHKALDVEVQQTPNPETRKFLPGCDISPGGPLAFSSAEEAQTSPFAAALFHVQGVSGVFLGYNFVSVTKDPAATWDVLEPVLVAAVRQACEAQLSLWEDQGAVSDGVQAGVSAQEGPKAEVGTIERDIQDLLDQRIRPFVARDGGDITFHRFEDGVVYLTLRGACSGCPSASLTLKRGVENLLRHFIPEVQSVEAAS